MKRIWGNKNFLIGVFLLFLIFFSLIGALFLIRTPQKIEKKAAAPEGTVLLEPARGSFSPNQNFLIAVKLNSGNWQVSGVDFTLVFDPTKIQIINISPELTSLPEAVLVDVQNNQARFVFVNTGDDKTLPHGNFVVAKITARGIEKGSAELSFSKDYEVSKKGVGDEGYLLNINNIAEKGFYTFTSSHECSGNGDINLDGRVSEADIMVILLDWSPFGPAPTPRPGFCSSDLNNDGKISESDIMNIILNWTL